MSKIYRLRVAQPGYDALKDPKERMVFDSQYDTLKLYLSGSGSQSVPAGNGGTLVSGEATVTIPHNLGYKPTFMVFCSSEWRTSDKLSPYAYKSIGAISPDGGQYAVDATNLYLYLYNGATAIRTVNYRYHIYYNELV